MAHRFIRFIPTSGRLPLIGEPVNRSLDVGLATYKGEEIEVEVYTGSSILTPGRSSGKKVKVKRVLSPLSESEVGTIRCIGLNVSDTPYHRKVSQ